MNKEELVQAVAKSTNSTQKDVLEIVNAFISTVEESVSKGQKVTLVGFGTFESRERAARSGRNPRTGATIEIKAKRVPAFSAGKQFKELVK